MTDIGQAQTEWAFPAVFATKKNGTLRFCVDYCKFNAITVRDLFAMPRVDI